MFDGETVSKTDETGRKLETNVFAGGRMVARQLVYYGTLTGDLYQVEWKNQDNFGLSDLRTRKRHDSDTVTGDSFAPLELDAAGTELLSLLPEGGGIDPDLPMEQNQGDVWQTANDPNYYNRGLGGAASPACAVGSFLIDCSRVRFADGIGNGVFGSLERAQRESARQIGARLRVRELVAASPSGPPVLRSGGSRPGSQRISSDGESILIGYEWWLEPIFNDSWSVIALIGSGQERYEYRLDETRRVKAIKDVINYAASSAKCAEAFRAIGATPVGEQRENLTIVTQNVFGEPLWDSGNDWTMGTDVGKDMRQLVKAKPKTRDVSTVGTYKHLRSDFTMVDTGRRFLGITNAAFDGQEYLSVTVVHSLVHTGGIVGKDSSFSDRFRVGLRVQSHDLKYLGKKYLDLLKHCTREGGSKLLQ
ncbi:MAG: hypothetical protein KF762_17295 [Acidobacteria bacterium]|nr:hypothetical protein [Acidobacteriota bacterium]